jgi:isopentenyl-diphosphate delta-isomerase
VDNGPTDDSFAVAGRDTVVLVDEAGEPTGIAAKLRAHAPPGLLHLAFSVVLYRPDGLVLLQQRAGTKYHFPLAWANSCCSHPRPGEGVVGSAERRVRDELGLDCRLAEVGTFTYRATCPVSGLVEYEFDHVLVGVVHADPIPDPTEVAALRWAVPAEVITAPPADGAPWLVPVLRLAERSRRTGAEPPG